MNSPFVKNENYELSPCVSTWTLAFTSVTFASQRSEDGCTDTRNSSSAARCSSARAAASTLHRADVVFLTFHPTRCDRVTLCWSAARCTLPVTLCSCRPDVCHAACKHTVTQCRMYSVNPGWCTHCAQCSVLVTLTLHNVTCQRVSLLTLAAVGLHVGWSTCHLVFWFAIPVYSRFISNFCRLHV